MSLREVWWAAVGAHDRDVRNRAFWMQAFGKSVTPETMIDMHPLRRLEKKPPDPAEEKAAANMGWAMLAAGLKTLNDQRKG